MPAGSDASASQFSTRTVDLPQGSIRVRELGSGRPVVFVHGVLVDGRIWDGVAARLAAGGGVRCVLPDLPLGSHTTPMAPDADLTPPTVAGLVADLLDALDLDDVTLVGSDSGGAISQMLVTTRPERVGRVVLLNCDAFEVFPPGIFKGMLLAPKIPGGVAALAAALRIGVIQRGTFRLLTERPMDRALLREWCAASKNPAIRRDVGKLLAGASKDQTLDAGAKLGRFGGPALLVWGDADRFFTSSLAERLSAAFADARIERIAGGKTFVQLDRPEAVADAIAAFLAAPAAVRAA